MEIFGNIKIGDQQSVQRQVSGLYASHLLSDISLVVGDIRYPAHRMILSASSDVFQCMLVNPQWQESKESEIRLVEDPQSCQVFPQFLKFIYTGQVKIFIEKVLPLLSLADKYNIKDLTVLCSDYMMKNIALAGSRGFLISWLQYTMLFKCHQQLVNELQNFLKLNIEIVGNSRGFTDIDPNNLIELLQQNDLVVKNEATLFDIVERYLEAKLELIVYEKSLTEEDKNHHWKSLIEGICAHIRFPMMIVRELASIPLKQIIGFSKKFFRDRMALGMSFHAGLPYQLKGDAGGINLMYTPRLYTSDAFCLEMRVEEFFNVENYKSFSACFFSLAKFPFNNSFDGTDESTVKWEIDFHPRGIRLQRANMIIGYEQISDLYISESILRTVRVKCTCKANFDDDLRFKIGVLISARQDDVEYVKTLHTRTEYFSRENCVITIDNLVPYEELSNDRSIYLIGENHDTVRIHVIITPMQKILTQSSPNFELERYFPPITIGHKMGEKRYVPETVRTKSAKKKSVKRKPQPEPSGRSSSSRPYKSDNAVSILITSDEEIAPVLSYPSGALSHNIRNQPADTCALVSPLLVENEPQPGPSGISSSSKPQSGPSGSSSSNRGRKYYDHAAMVYSDSD